MLQNKEWWSSGDDNDDDNDDGDVGGEVRLLNTGHIPREDDRSGKEAMVNYGIWQKKSTDTLTWLAFS